MESTQKINIPAHWRRRYFTILSGQAISLVTSGILQMTLIFYLTEKTGSALVLSLATFFGFLPQALLGPFIGVWVDRWNRKLVMIGSDLFIALSGVAFGRSGTTGAFGSSADCGKSAPSGASSGIPA